MSHKDSLEEEAALPVASPHGSMGAQGGDVEAALGSASQPSRGLNGDKGVLVVFSHLTYTLRTARKQLVELLQDVTGWLQPGELTAVIGPSGCGKTTLLDILAGRKTVGRLSEKSAVLYNGRPPTAAFLRSSVGYVEQHDTLLPMLTAREMLLYTAHLKHGRRWPLAQKQAQVEDLIRRLHLEDCADTRIGTPMARGVSGGEAKRANIGITLISGPKVLLLDEPTSGLDAFHGHSVVEVVKGLAEDGITLCAAIHSPSPLTFALFDRVLVLQRGRVVYFGPNGEALHSYFVQQFPALRPMRPEEGIATFVVDVTTKAGKERRDATFADTYGRSPLLADNERAVETLLAALPGGGGTEVRQGSPSSERSGAWGLKALLSRHNDVGTASPLWWALIIMWRYRSLRAYQRVDFIMARVADKILVLFLIVTLYWGLGDNMTADDATSIAAILFMVTVMSAYGGMGILPGFAIERPIYLRERSDGLYRPITYLLYKSGEELTVAWLASVPYSLLLFYLVRLQGSFMLFWCVIVVSIGIATVLTLLAGSLFSSIDVAGAALPSYMSTLIFFSGFLLPWDQLPVYWRWYAAIDYLRYSWGSLMVNQFEGERDIEAYGGQSVLTFYGLQNVSKWAWLGWEAVFLTVFFACTWLALAFVRHQRR